AEDEALDDVELAAGAAVDSPPLAEVAPAEADLLMPPCPLQAPRPPCGEVVPSLHTTGLEALCAWEGAGAASSAPARAATPISPVNLVRVICSSSSRVPLIIQMSEYSKRCARGTRRRAAATRANAADVVRLQPLATLKLDEDHP